MRSVVETEVRKPADALKDISGEVYPLAPLGEDGEEGTTSRADEDNKDGTDPQTEVGVGTTTATAVEGLFISSKVEHGLGGSREGGGNGGRLQGQVGVYEPGH